MSGADVLSEIFGGRCPRPTGTLPLPFCTPEELNAWRSARPVVLRQKSLELVRGGAPVDDGYLDGDARR